MEPSDESREMDTMNSTCLSVDAEADKNFGAGCVFAGRAYFYRQQALKYAHMAGRYLHLAERADQIADLRWERGSQATKNVADEAVAARLRASIMAERSHRNRHRTAHLLRLSELAREQSREVDRQVAQNAGEGSDPSS